MGSPLMVHEALRAVSPLRACPGALGQPGRGLDSLRLEADRCCRAGLPPEVSGDRLWLCLPSVCLSSHHSSCLCVLLCLQPPSRSLVRSHSQVPGSGEDTEALSGPLQPLGHAPLTVFLSRPGAQHRALALNRQQPTDVWGWTSQGFQPLPKGQKCSSHAADGTT